MCRDFYLCTVKNPNTQAKLRVVLLHMTLARGLSILFWYDRKVWALFAVSSDFTDKNCHVYVMLGIVQKYTNKVFEVHL